MDLSASNTIIEQARRVYCVYPISGTYTSPQRNLFYLTTAFALLGHAHEWLTAGCLAFTLSYSSTAAVHGLALALLQGYGGDGHHGHGHHLLHRDGDVFAVDAVVQWAMYASFVCALLCPRLLGRHLVVLVRGWCSLLVAARLALTFSTPRLTAGLAASFVLSRRGADGQWSDPCAAMGDVRTLFRGYPGDSMRPVVWGTVDITDASLAQLPAGPGGGGGGGGGVVIPQPVVVRAADIAWFLALQTLKNSLLLAPSIQTLAADRRATRNDVFVRLLARRVPRPPSRRKGPSPFLAVVIVRFLQLRWFLLRCLPFLSVIDFPIRITARILFRALGIRRPRLEDMSFLEPQLSRRRYQAARYAAMAFYVLTTLGYVAWIPAVASFATDRDIPLTDIPESETFRAVGQWSSWLTLSLAVLATLASRLLLGIDQMESMDAWIQHHRFMFLYTQARDWLAAEWAETKEWWRHPEKEAIASLRAAEQDDDTDDMFTSRMSDALETFSTHRPDFLLPLPTPWQPDEQLRGQESQPVSAIDVESAPLRSTVRKGRGKERQA